MALLRVKESHTQFDKHGVPNVLVAGQLVESDSPLVKGRAHLFEAAEDTVRDDTPAPFHASPVVTETADATPGTARTRTTPPAKKTAAKAEKPSSD